SCTTGGVGLPRSTSGKPGAPPAIQSLRIASSCSHTRGRRNSSSPRGIVPSPMRWMRRGAVGRAGAGGLLGGAGGAARGGGGGAGGGGEEEGDSALPPRGFRAGPGEGGGGRAPGGGGGGSPPPPPPPPPLDVPSPRHDRPGDQRADHGQQHRAGDEPVPPRPA